MDATAIEQAGETLFDQVYIPAFMQKCAARGFTFSNEDELHTALQNTHLLGCVEAQRIAGANSGLHKAANAALRGMLGEDVKAAEKVAQVETEATVVSQCLGEDEGVKQAASLLAQLTAAEEQVAD